jgi:hypothetical protein
MNGVFPVSVTAITLLLAVLATKANAVMATMFEFSTAAPLAALTARFSHLATRHSTDVWPELHALVLVSTPAGSSGTMLRLSCRLTPAMHRRHP